MKLFTISILLVLGVVMLLYGQQITGPRTYTGAQNFSGATLSGISSGCSLTTGTVSYTSLTANATSQDVTIMSSVSAKSRFAWAQIAESSTQFAGTPTLTVTMGRSGVGTDLIAAPLALKVAGGQNYSYDVPRPPAIGSGTYDIVLEFIGSAALGNGTVTNFTAGSVNWEVCTVAVP